MNRLKVLLKNNKLFFYLYRFTFNIIFNLLKLFVKVHDNVILFNCYGGQKFDDSTRAIYEYMIHNKKYENYKIYWSFDEPNKFILEKGEKVRNNSIKYFIVALQSKYWITNSGIERGLKFKNKKTIYINTWHGTPLKKIGRDQNNDLCRFETTKPDVMYAQSNYDIKTISKALGIEKNKFALVGLPRNDELFNVSENEIEKIKDKLKIPKDKKVILYAPTFREYNRDKDGCIIAPPVDINKWKDKLSNKYIVLFRAHYEINKVIGIENDGFIFNYSDYDSINELLKISDILISDYSSIMIDYSILGRPIYCYAYDYEEYEKNRGLYIDIKNELPNGICITEDELLEQIINCDIETQKEKTIKFAKKFIQNSGNATKYIDQIIK